MINHFRFLQRGINYATAATENYYLTKYNYDYSTTSERAFSIIQNMSICGLVAWWVSNSCSLNAYHTYCISDMTLKNTFLHGLNIIQETILVEGIIIFLSYRELKERIGWDYCKKFYGIWDHFLSAKQDLIIVKVCRRTQSLIGVLRFQKLFSLYYSREKTAKVCSQALITWFTSLNSSR